MPKVTFHIVGLNFVNTKLINLVKKKKREKKKEKISNYKKNFKKIQPPPQPTTPHNDGVSL